jgi:hypothetical protein
VITYVLMCKRTANLLVGHRVGFIDNGFTPPEFYVVTHDGWIVNSLSAGPFLFYMNREWVEENFEVLGEL